MIRVSSLLLAAAILCASWNRAEARAVTRPVSKQGEKVTQQAAEQHGWPAGTLKLINHPLRHSGWRHIFNTDPADRINFVFLPRSNKELKTIVKLFAKIAGEHGTVVLDPRHCQPHSFVVPIKEELNAAVVINIGSQKVLNHWYANLPVDRQGNKIHNNAPISAPPTAAAPTLTIFAGNKAIDVDKLKLPKSLVVMPAVTDQHRADHPDDGVVAAIDRCVARHLERGGKTWQQLLKPPKGTPLPPAAGRPAKKAAK